MLIATKSAVGSGFRINRTPFGRTVVKKPTHGVMSTIGNVLWFFIGGWWLVLLHIVTGVLLCLSVIGIPFGLANFKLIKVSLTPLGRDIVSVEEARSTGGGGTVSFPAQPGSPSA